MDDPVQPGADANNRYEVPVGGALGPQLLGAPTHKGWSVVSQRAAVIGMGASVVLHAILLSIAGLVLAGGRGGGGGGVGNALPLEVAVVDESQLTSLNEGVLTVETPGVEELKNSVDLAPMPVIEAAGGNALPDAGDVGGNAGTGLGGSGTGTGIGVGEGTGGSGAGGTSFFGREARGRRFGFIVDVSGSMEGEKLAMLKRELSSAINKLPENAQFVILPFESGVRNFMLGGKYAQATSKNKQAALREIEGLTAAGGTEPFGGFLTALNLRPRPDAIYFMTDGQFNNDVPEKIRSLMRGGRNVPIHGICLMDNSSEEMMRKIASMSEGTYTFINPGGKRP